MDDLIEFIQTYGGMIGLLGGIASAIYTGYAAWRRRVAEDAMHKSGIEFKRAEALVLQLEAQDKRINAMQAQYNVDREYDAETIKDLRADLERCTQRHEALERKHEADAARYAMRIAQLERRIQAAGVQLATEEQGG